jgi:long-chain acyl-CoA synthetase
MPDLGHWATSTPDADAIISATGTRTFAELDANATRLAHALRRRGLEPGDAVAIIGKNDVAFVETVFACLRGGYRLTPVNWHLTADEAGYVVDDCEARALVASGPLLDLARGCLDVAPACSVALISEVGDAGLAGTGAESYETAIAAEGTEPLDVAVPGGTMLYTSGTTGRPTGVSRPPVAAAPASMNIAGYDESGGDVHLCSGPLYHAAPLAFSLNLPLSFGATVVLMDHWDAAEALELIERHGVTHTHLVPTMFHRLLALPESTRAEADVSTLRHVLHGAAPCPVPVKRQMIEWFGPVIFEYYAATEGVGSFVDSETWLAHPGTVGRPFMEGLVVIGDENADPLPPGEVGLVFLKALDGTRFSYFKDDEKTAATFRGDYFTMGDVGYMDDDGYLYLTDRSANLIISGGVNIYPAEVDAVLLEHPAVGDAAVIGVPDEEWGESVLAVVELRDGTEGSEALEQELVEHCRSRLAHFKCPRSVEFIDRLPREDNGKIYKRRLREVYRQTTSSAP